MRVYTIQWGIISKEPKKYGRFTGPYYADVSANSYREARKIFFRTHTVTDQEQIIIESMKIKRR